MTSNNFWPSFCETLEFMHSGLSGLSSPFISTIEGVGQWHLKISVLGIFNPVCAYTAFFMEWEPIISSLDYLMRANDKILEKMISFKEPVFLSSHIICDGLSRTIWSKKNCIQMSSIWMMNNHRLLLPSIWKHWMSERIVLIGESLLYTGLFWL